MMMMIQQQVWKEQKLLDELEWMQVKKSFLEELIPTHFLGTTTYGFSVRFSTSKFGNYFWFLILKYRQELESL